jgi:3-hydroxyisobutyrate dehydrogenase-like beta-hydroxyacid dehydrogenase
MAGLGQMGGPIARRMLTQSVDLMVYARRSEVRDEFSALGATTTATLAELARSCKIIVVCVFSDAQLGEITEGPDGLLANMAVGSILVSHTTGSPDFVRALSASAAERGVHVIDAPVSGDQTYVPEGRLTIIVGGDETKIDACRPVLSTYSNNIVFVGPVGSAMAVKLVNNLLWAANLQLAQQAILFGEAMGADRAALRAAIAVSSGQSYAFEVAAGFGSLERLDTLAGPYMRKDINLVLDVANTMGVDPGVLTTAALSGPLRLSAVPHDLSNTADPLRRSTTYTLSPVPCRSADTGRSRRWVRASATA